MFGLNLDAKRLLQDRLVLLILNHSSNMETVFGAKPTENQHILPAFSSLFWCYSSHTVQPVRLGLTNPLLLNKK